MKKIVNVSIIVTLGVLFFCFIGCESKDRGTIKIGVILPLTGEVATYGQSVKKGLDIAFENAQNKDVQPIYEDSKADKKTAINALEKLFMEQVKFFIGDATSSVTYEIGPRIQAKNGLLLVPIATGDKIREVGNNIFMLSPRNEKQTQKIVNYIKTHYSNKRIGCLFKQNDYGVNIANTFFKLSGKEVYSQAYQEGQDDFRSTLLKFKSNHIDLVFLPGNYEETAAVLKQAMEINYKPIFIGTDGTYSPKLVDLAGQASEGFLLSMMPVDYNSKIYKEFEKAYLKKYNSIPDIFACYGYESGLIMLASINATSRKTPEEVGEYIRSHSFDSLTDKLSFVNTGGPQGGPAWPSWEADRDYNIYVVKNGNFIPSSL